MSCSCWQYDHQIHNEPGVFGAEISLQKQCKRGLYTPSRGRFCGFSPIPLKSEGLQSPSGSISPNLWPLAERFVTAKPQVTIVAQKPRETQDTPPVVRTPSFPLSFCRLHPAYSARPRSTHPSLLSGLSIWPGMSLLTSYLNCCHIKPSCQGFYSCFHSPLHASTWKYLHMHTHVFSIIVCNHCFWACITSQAPKLPLQAAPVTPVTLLLDELWWWWSMSST